MSESNPVKSAPAPKPVEPAPAVATSKPAESSLGSKPAPPKGAPTARVRGKVSVGVDTTPEDVVELDDKGFLLHFSSDVEGFLELPDEVVQKLGYENRVNYGVARGVWLALKKDVGRVGGNITVLPPLAASAGRRLEIQGQERGMHYCWKRPDELVQAGMLGYSMVQGGSEKTFAQTGDGTHKVGAFGQTELVLMKIPEEKFAAIEAEAGAKSRALIDAQTANAEESIRRSGGVPFRPKDNDGIQWREGEEKG